VTHLGPATEAILARTFGERLLITMQEAAKLLGMDIKTLRSMTDEGLIRAVRRGKVRAYIEADIRRFLLECQAPCDPQPKKQRRTVARAGKIVPFTQRARS
jgi:excisionase family DNA binding protein